MTELRIAGAQLNLTVGDLDGNIANDVEAEEATSCEEIEAAYQQAIAMACVASKRNALRNFLHRYPDRMENPHHGGNLA